MNDLISKIQTELPGFSKGQKQIARYILEHYDKGGLHDGEPSGRNGGCERIHGRAVCD